MNEVKNLNLIINKCLKYIEDNLENELNISIISMHFGYSKYHFSRLFKSEMNISLMEYVNNRRFIKASQNILDGEKIIDIAFKYGWLSHNGFSKAFKKRFGFSPVILRTITLQLDRSNYMSHVFLNKTKDIEQKEKLFEILKEKLIENKFSTKKAEKIYKISCKCYEGVKRYSGDEYITHTLNVAIILATIGTKENVIIASMLCDVLQKTTIKIEELNLDTEIKEIVLKVNSFDISNLSIMNDEDMIMIKLAQKLHNMRTIDFIDDNKKFIKSKEILDLFVPLARKISNDKLAEELNDLVLTYIN